MYELYWYAFNLEGKSFQFKRFVLWYAVNSLKRKHSKKILGTSLNLLPWLVRKTHSSKRCDRNVFMRLIKPLYTYIVFVDPHMSLNLLIFRLLILNYQNLFSVLRRSSRQTGSSNTFVRRIVILEYGVKETKNRQSSSPFQWERRLKENEIWIVGLFCDIPLEYYYCLQVYVPHNTIPFVIVPINSVVSIIYSYWFCSWANNL